MLRQLTGNSTTWQRDQNNLNSALSRQLHCGYTIGVRSYQADPVHAFQRGIGRDIEADPHIDALLLEIRNEIRIGKSRYPFTGTFLSL